MPEQFRNVPQRDPFLTETARVGVPEIVPAKIRNLGLADGVDKPMGIDVERLASGIPNHATFPVPAGAEDHQSAHGWFWASGIAQVDDSGRASHRFCIPWLSAHKCAGAPKSHACCQAYPSRRSIEKCTAYLSDSLEVSLVCCCAGLFQILEAAAIAWYRHEPFRQSITDVGGGLGREFSPSHCLFSPCWSLSSDTANSEEFSAKAS